MTYLTGDSVKALDAEGIPPLMSMKDVFVQYIALCR
jgi:hypothetical protein